MNLTKLLEKATVVIKDCVKLRPNEELLIVTDETVSISVLNSFRSAACLLDANTLVLTYTPRRFISLREYTLFAGASMQEFDPEPPKGLSAAMKESNAILFLTSDVAMMFSKSLKSLLEEEKKIMFIPYISEENMMRLLPDSSEEVIELKKTTKKVAQLVDECHEARITSPEGTDIKMTFGNYRTNCSTGVLEPGMGFGGRMDFLPGGQVSRVPNDNSAEGVVVVDRSIAAPEYKALYEPIKFSVEKGDVFEITGGADAKNLKRYFEKLGDSSVYHVTELGIGLNPRCKFAGISGPIEDTHTLGCVSMAFGCDIHIGGTVKGKIHNEGTLANPSLRLNSKTVIQNAILKIN